MKNTYDKQNQIMAILNEIEDPRKKRGIRYRFADLLFICIYAVLAGCNKSSDIACYAELHKEYFMEVTEIKNVPSHDTFSRILRIVNFEKLSESLAMWLREAYPEIYIKYEDMKVLHIDGKAVRAAAEKSNGENPRYLLNAMYEGESIGLIVKEIGQKENEITKLPDYLRLFNLENTIVTIDAIGTNNTVIPDLVTGGATYVVPVKENQKNLKRCIDERVSELKNNGVFKNLDHVSQLNKGHGRIEKVRASLIKDTSFIYENLGLSSFYGTIARIAIIEKNIIQKVNGKETETNTIQYMITNMENISIETLYKIKQSHWNIEMNHWMLDVQLKEDAMTGRKGNSMMTSAVLNRFCLLIKKHDSEYTDAPLKNFIMANMCNIQRIERLLFCSIQESDHK